MLSKRQLWSVVAVQFVTLIAVSHMATGMYAERTYLRDEYFAKLGLAQQEVGVITEVAIQYREEVAALRQEQRRTRFEAYIRSVNPKAPAEEIVKAVLQAEAETGIDATWLLAKQKQESYFNPHAVSATGCRGLTQMCTAASKDVGLDPAHVFRVRANVLAGARYLKLQLNATGSMQRALNRYNGNDDPLFVQRIERHRARLLMGMV